MYDNYGYSSNSDSTGMCILKIIGGLILCYMLVSCSQSCSRSEANMVMIESPYCYEADTKIIYLETEAGRYGIKTTYTPYYDENGNLCRYNVSTGEWIPLEK